VAALVLTAAALEAVAWAWSTHRRAALARRSDGGLLIVRDAALGWRATPNRDIAVPGGRFTTGPRGWRRHDAVDGRPLLVVLGDSYTHAAGVPDGAAYHDAIARHLRVAVAALGVNGYGTVQEWLVARAAATVLPRPAAVLLNNNLMPRPFLDGSGAVSIADPRRLHERLVLGRELTRRVLAGRMRTVERDIEAGDAEAVALYARELSRTAQALRLLRGVFPDAAAVAFNVGGSRSRIGRDLERLARETGFAYTDLGPRFGDPAQLAGIVQADGAHWNEAGHALAGTILAETLAPLLASKR
jgi:hypothetical protein